MDAYSYTDIFDTKGIEYLVVIAFLAILIPTWIWLNRPVKRASGLAADLRGLSAAILRIPAGLFYNPNHTWAFLQKNGSARIGIDDLVLQMTGGVSVDYLKKEGDWISKGEWVARIFNGDRELKIPSPVSGEIRKTNSAAKKDNEIINSDPYDKGWLCMIKPDDWKSEVSDYMMDKEAQEWTKAELERCREFVISEVGTPDDAKNSTVMLAGGELTINPLAEMSAETWKKFQQQFLH